jgi:uncharacterized membrane protein YoaK (UPF0700 family)
MRQKVTKNQWEALIHWNFALVGGFLGAYAILLHMGNFGSAQTGNIMEMAASLVSGEWYDVLLRFLALPLFGGGVVVSYLLTHYTNINMRKLAILVDAAGLVASSLLPLKPVLVGLYPIFFCSAFQWGVYSSANGYNSATIFSSNNFKQAMLGWTQYFLTKDPEFKKKGILYTNTVLSFFIGACYGAIAVNAFAVRAAYLGSVPLAMGWILVVKHSMVLESERPQEIAKEAETELEDAELLETEQK